MPDEKPIALQDIIYEAGSVRVRQVRDNVLYLAGKCTQWTTDLAKHQVETSERVTALEARLEEHLSTETEHVPGKCDWCVEPYDLDDAHYLDMGGDRCVVICEGCAIEGANRAEKEKVERALVIGEVLDFLEISSNYRHDETDLECTASWIRERAKYLLPRVRRHIENRT